MTDVGRNSPCPCGSGRKYKQCCGSPERRASAAPRLTESATTVEAAVEYASAGRLQEAYSACVRLLSTDPDNVRVLRLAGDVSLRLDRLDLALKRLQRAVELAPSDPQARCALGDVYRRLKRSAEAITEFAAAWRLAPDQPAGFDRLIATCMREGRLEEGVAYFRMGLATDAYLSASNAHLVPALAAMGLAGELRASAGARQPIDPVVLVACSALGTAANRLRNAPAAQRVCRNGNAVDPTCSTIYLDLFTALFEHERYAEALACMQALATVEPENPTAKHAIAALTGVPLDRAAPEYCARLFDAAAHKFESHLVGKLKYDVPGKLANLVRQLVNPPDRAWDILDLGCGTGLVGQSFEAFARTLVGVDLSGAMLEVAAKRRIYTRLAKADIVDFLCGEAPAQYDAILAADVYIYLGKLDSVFEGARRSLRSHGRVIFSIEALQGAAVASATPGTDYALTISGRFAHAPEYIERLAARHELTIERKMQTILRTEGLKPAAGWLYVLRRT